MTDVLAINKLNELLIVFNLIVLNRQFVKIKIQEVHFLEFILVTI